MNTLLVVSTASSMKEAHRIARRLIEGRFAACVNIIPGVRSFFYWEEKLCQEKEVLIWIKTVKGKSKKIINEIKSIHSYSVPEIIFLKINGGEKKYLKWVKTMVEMKRTKNIKKY